MLWERAPGINNVPSRYYSPWVVMERLNSEQGEEGNKAEQKLRLKHKVICICTLLQAGH